MNYSKSLSELLFEDEKKLNINSKDADIIIKSANSLATLLVPKENLSDFSRFVKSGDVNKIATTSTNSNKLKSNNKSNKKDILDDTSALNIDKLELGSKTADISFTQLKNIISSRLAEKLNPLLADDNINADVRTLNVMQSKDIAGLPIGNIRLDFINVAGEDTLKSSPMDIKKFDDIGHVFFMVLGKDPTNPKEFVYITNGGNVVVFAMPSKKRLSGKAKEMHLRLFQVNESLNSQGQWLHETSLANHLLSETATQGESTVEVVPSLLGTFRILKDKVERLIKGRGSNANVDALIEEIRDSKDQGGLDPDDKVFFQGLIDELEKYKAEGGVPDTAPPRAVRPPAEYDEKIDSVVMKDYLKSVAKDEDIEENVLKLRDASLAQKRKYLGNKMKQKYANDILYFLDNKEKSKEHTVKIKYKTLESPSIEKELVCTASWNKKQSKWKVKFESDFKIFESFVHQQGLRLLLEDDDLGETSAETGFYGGLPSEEDSKGLESLSQAFQTGEDYDLLDIGEMLSFTRITNIDVTSKGENPKPKEASAPDSQPEEAEAEQDVSNVLEPADILVDVGPQNLPEPEGATPAPQPEPVEEPLLGPAPPSAEIPNEEFTEDGIERIYAFFYKYLESNTETGVYFLESQGKLSDVKHLALFKNSDDNKIFHGFYKPGEGGLAVDRDPVSLILDEKLKYIIIIDYSEQSNPQSNIDIKKLLKNASSPLSNEEASEAFEALKDDIEDFDDVQISDEVEALQGSFPDAGEINDNYFTQDNVERFIASIKAFIEKNKDEIIFVVPDADNFNLQSYQDNPYVVFSMSLDGSIMVADLDSTFQGIKTNYDIAKHIVKNKLKDYFIIGLQAAPDKGKLKDLADTIEDAISPSSDPAPEPDPGDNLQQGTGQSETSDVEVPDEVTKVIDDKIEINKPRNIRDDIEASDFIKISNRIFDKIKQDNNLIAAFSKNDNEWIYFFDAIDNDHKFYASTEDIRNKLQGISSQKFIFDNKFFTYEIKEKSQIEWLFKPESAPSQGPEESQGEQEAEASSAPSQNRGNVKDLDRLFSINSDDKGSIDITIFVRDKNKKLGSFKAQLIFVEEGEDFVTKIQFEDNPQIDMLESLMYRHSLSRLLFEDNEEQTGSSLPARSLEDFKQKMSELGYEFDSAQVEGFEKLNKRETDADVDAENFKSTMEEILKKFSEKPGLNDIVYEKIKVLKVIEGILRNGGTKELKKQYPKGFNMADIVESIDAELQANEITQFVADFVGFVYKNEYKEKINDFINDFRSNRIKEKDVQKYLQNYFKLNDLVLESKRGSNKELLNEEITLTSAFAFLGEGIAKPVIGLLQGLFAATGIYGQVILYIILLYAGIKVADKFLEKIFGKKLSGIIGEKIKEGKIRQKTLDAIAQNDDLRSEINKQLKNFVSFLICSYCKKKFGIEFSVTGDSVKKSGDFKFTGDFAQDMNTALTSEIQSTLFTQTFRDSAKQEAGRDLSDDELLQSYEAMLDDMVMSFMQDIQKSEYADIQSERDKIAYGAEMDKKDAGVFAGVAAFPASIAVASTLGIATGGVGLLAAGFIGGLMGGIGAEAIVKAKGVKRGPKEQEFMRNAEKDKLTIRNVVILLAKKALDIKESYGLSDDFIYLAGLTLLKEGLLEAEGEGEEGDATESGEATTEEGGVEKKKAEPEIRGQISWDVISRKLTSSNFFLFKPTYTRAVGKQAAAEAQYDFGSHLAALTQECFGLKITDVEDMDIREAQTMSVTEMMVNQSAGMGDGSIRYARTKGLNGKGMNDPINMEEFGHLLTQCDGDTTKVILYLMMNGRLDSFLNALKGGKNTPEDIFNYLGGMIKGENFPGSMSSSKQQAIENINSSEWVTKLVNQGKINSPIKIVYNSLSENELKSFLSNIEKKLVEFSQGYARRPVSDKDMTIDNHDCLISKSQGNDESRNSHFYSFNCGPVGARKIIDEHANFIDATNDESSKDESFLIKVIVDDIHQAFKGFTFKIEASRDFNEELQESLSKRITTILVLRAMFANKVGPYHLKHTRSEDDEHISKQDYATTCIRAIMGKKVPRNTQRDQTREEKVRIANLAFQNAFVQKERVSSFYEEHLDLYRLWQVR